MTRAVTHLVISAAAIAFGLVAVVGWWSPMYCLACWIILVAAVEAGSVGTVRWAALPFVLLAGVGTAAYGQRMATILIGVAGVIHGLVAAVAVRSRKPETGPECRHRFKAAAASSARARADVSACSAVAACTTSRLRMSPLASNRVQRPALCSDSSQ